MVMRQEPEANGATYSNTGGTGCYAEFGMTGPNDSDSWQTCLFGGGGSAPPPPPAAADLGSGCAWTTGDGSGGTEESLGDAPTAEACVQLVQQTRAEANGATYRQGGTACYAEFGMIGHIESDTWQTCLLPASVGCDFHPGDGTGDSEEYLGDTDTPAMCASLVATTRPDANGATYSGADSGGSACYAEFGMTGDNGSESWQTCMLQAGAGAASCADEFTDVFASIQSTCCVNDADCEHGSPHTCNGACGDLVLDFWNRCSGAVASSFGAALHDQLDSFAQVCDRATGAGSGGSCPEAQLFDAAVACAGVSRADRGFCAGRCGSLLAPLVRECEGSDLGLDQLFSSALRTAAGQCPARPSGGPPPPPVSVDNSACRALAADIIPTITSTCCKNRECGSTRINKCSANCAE